MKKRILIVEDNHDLRRVVKIFLEESGFETIEAESIKEALKKCAHEQPHLIILDLYLTNELGLDVSSEIAKDPAYYGIPKIIAVSGTVGGELVKTSDFRKQYNIDMFIKKPFDLSELVSGIKLLLQGN